MLPDMLLHMAVRLLCRDNYAEAAATTKGLAGFRHPRAHVARMGLFDRDYHSLRFFVHTEREHVDIAFFS